MAFNLTCNNKGCGKTQESVLDVRSNEVHCSECGNIISGVSHFTKSQMKTLGQIKRPAKSAYAVKCDKCKNEALPKLDANNSLICSCCSSQLKNVSAPFAMLIKAAIAKGPEDI